MHRPEVFYHDDLGGELFEESALHDEESDDEGFEEVEDGDKRPNQASGAWRWLPGSSGKGGDPSLVAVHEWDECRRRGVAGDFGQEVTAGALQTYDLATDEPAAELWPEISGFFEKRSPMWVNGWRRRSYLLRDGRLLYFKAERPDRPLGVLDFGLVRYELHCQWLRGDAWQQDPQEQELEGKKGLRECCDDCTAPVPASWRTFYLKPKAFPDKVFAFRGPRESVAALVDRLSDLAAAPRQPPSAQERAVVSLRNFWRYPFISEPDFQARVESGDLLLFQGTDQAAKLQRAATGSDYDHVGLILRGSGGEVLLLEATGTSGVAVIPWRLFMRKGWYRCYKRLAYRKVYFPRSRVQLLALRKYICSILGRPYGLSVGKLLARSFSDEFNADGISISPSSMDSSPEDRTMRTFFCSELVAACLKRCGVLAGAKASCCYWPGSFAQDSHEPLPLQELAYVGEEQLILCA